MESESDTQGSSRRLLLAEDEHVIRETLGMILRKAGYEVIAVESGTLAVETASRWQPDIFLSDVVMPGINGVEAAIRIRDRYPECRVLLISGQAVTTDLLKDARLRGYEFDLLLKPIHPNDLLSILRTS